MTPPMTDEQLNARIGTLERACEHGYLSACSGEVLDVVAELRHLRSRLAAAAQELVAAEIANSSLIPGAMLTATEIACLTVERDGARAERAEARATLDLMSKEWETSRNELAATITTLTAQRDQAVGERDEAVAVLAVLVEQFDDDDLEVSHALDWDGPHTADKGMPHPVCGDDNDACSRKTCPAIWVVNDAARIVQAHGAHRKGR